VADWVLDRGMVGYIKRNSARVWEGTSGLKSQRCGGAGRSWEAEFHPKNNDEVEDCLGKDGRRRET
jgi:hypothetical protein